MTALAKTSAADLLARVFETEALPAEYPLVFDPRFEGRVQPLDADGPEARAACTVLERTFHVGGRSLRGGLIGSVATDPAWRGQGLATRLLERTEADLRERGALFALLWADDPRFYLARGYAPLGAETDHRLVSELARSLPGQEGVRVLRAQDVPHLHRLHARHATRVARTPEEMRALLAVPGMLTLVRERAPGPGQALLPVAYASLGRGRDLANAIHDWAGAPEDVLALLGAHLRRRFPSEEPGALFLMAPATESELARRLHELGVASRRGILGLGKLLDGSRACVLLAELLGEGSAVTWEGERARLRGRSGVVIELDLEGLQALLLGAPEVGAAARQLLLRLGCAHPCLPLEPFAFGLDSI